MIVQKSAEIHRISLSNGDIFVCLHILSENLYVMRYQLHGVYGISTAGQRMGIAPGSGPHFQHAAARPEIFFNVAHRSEELNRTMP